MPVTSVGGGSWVQIFTLKFQHFFLIRVSQKFVSRARKAYLEDAELSGTGQYWTVKTFAFYSII